jgi:hypothetical protein
MRGEGRMSNEAPDQNRVLDYTFTSAQGHTTGVEHLIIAPPSAVIGD